MHSDYAAAPTHNAHAGGGNPEWASLPPVQRKVMEYVTTIEADEGVHVSEISRKLGGGEQVM